MKKLLMVVSLMAVLSAPSIAAEPFGFAYQNTVQPLAGSAAVAPVKVGSAVCHQYFGVVSLGDCSIKKAMDNGKIRNLSHADQKVWNIMGFAKFTTKAYGQ